MLQAMNRDRVQGFLDTRGTKLVNERGQEVLLTGWGLGNWLLPEGYMWLAGGPRMDRPRTIERIVEEVAGKEYAARFWKKFRENYIRREDIARMAELGYNSVRIPINARLFLEEGPGLNWVDEGFELLDRCIDWCEEFGLYAFIDLHGAPGGQTGSNIDDSIDDLPRLFTDEDSFRKGVELWRKLAERYCDRWIVGGYDILNEPLRPVHLPGQEDTAYLLPELRRFYHEAIAAIRSVDQRHVLSIEGHHWASDPEIFDEKFDDKLLIHFHRYACVPDRKCYDPFIEASERLGSPLWLGETGENVHEWFTAMYPLAAELGIGFNIWPWKKMNCKNSPYSVNKPEGWDAITAYSRGGAHPGYEQAQAALDEYLDNMLMENCTENAVLHDAIFRRPGCTIRATDFDEVGGEGVAYHSARKMENPFGYREGTGMEIVEKQKDAKKEFGFDCLWRRFALGLEQGEYACYTLNDIAGIVRLEVHCSCSGAARVSVWQDGEQLGVYPLGGEVNGAVLFCNVSERAVRMLDSAGIPVILLNIDHCSKNVSSVVFDSFREGEMAANYLIGLGHRRLMHVAGIPDNYDAISREAGMRSAMERAGLQIEEGYRIEGLFSRQAAYRAMKAFLASGKPLPDAIFAANDLSAYGCMEAMKEEGVRVPEDVSLIGCDDIEICEICTPPLTTIRTNFERQGIIALEYLLDIMDGEHSGTVHYIGGQLIVRGSCRAKE